MRRRKPRVWKGTLAGLAGGLAGSFAMNQFQKIWNKARGGSSGESHEDPATVKAAETIAYIPEERKVAAGNAVHYAFGTANGAMYGALAEVSPTARAGAGSLFGATLFVVADEVLVPMFGWSRPPKKYPWTTHAYGLASHLVYGFATDGVRRVVRRAL